ncbi:MAG: hypothetical protein QXF26_05445, partial [Candidatus Bathyarchaeia archaeon]
KYATYAEAQQAYLEGALKQIQMKGYTAIQAIQLGLITGIQAVQLNLIKIEELVDYLRKKGGMSGELLVEEGYLTREQAIQYGFIKAQEGFQGIIEKPTLFLAGEKGPERVYIGPAGSPAPSINVSVSGPLVVVHGSVDRETAEYAARLIEERLRSVLVEASSTSAPAVSKRIRLGTVLTGV